MNYDSIRAYLLGKLSQRGKPSVGVALLRTCDYKSLLPQMVATAYEMILFGINRDKSGDPIGSAKLTQISTKIGEQVSLLFCEHKLEWEDNVRLGDLFIEAFFQCGYLTIHYPRIRNSSYTIKVTEQWVEESGNLPDSLGMYFLRGVTFESPADITSLTPSYYRDRVKMRYPLIKTWSKDYPLTADMITDLPWVRAANKLQQCPWMLNEKVFEAVEKYTPEDEDPERLASKILEHNFVLYKARQLLGKTFYSLIDFDYRGRIYPKETIFNFQSSDICRGLFLFGESKAVDEAGFFWMCVHTACCFNMAYSKDAIPEWCEEDYASHLEKEGLDDISVDKMTLQDRVNWTLNHLPEIQLMAEFNTLSDVAEKPVAYLAACHEVSNYLKYKEAGLIYTSRLPIPIDGSNNGWQHLGAISKDVKTGELVGLIPVDIQKDFYVQTAKKLIELTKDEDRTLVLSEMPMKKIRKAISKRGSMTRAYSAGAQKIADNMWNDVRKEGVHEEYGITQKMCKGFSLDLIKAIDAVCPGPLQTMKYLQDVSKYIIETEPTIKWVTPSKFYVLYEKPILVERKVLGTIAGVGKRDQVRHVGQVPLEKDGVIRPDPRGFASGISPNYIHSMDASHMASIICQWDGAFGAVHDSFSTHACDVEELCQITKDIFIDMYDEDNYFDNIKESFRHDLSDMLRQPPELGKLNIKEVNNSDYFFA